jgi:hypothetical protein
MQKQISPQDWETLSAYLDGQLKPRERVRLEARLHVDSDLKAAVNELKRTQDVLRALPRLRAPRNFVLKPEVAGQPTRTNARLYPAFRLASALASLLFVIVILGDITGVSRRILVPLWGQVPQPMELAAQKDEAAPRMEMMEAPAAEEPAVAMEMPAEESPAAKEMPIEAPSTESFSLEAAEMEAEAAPNLEGTGTGFTPTAESFAEKASVPVTDSAMEDEQGVNVGEEESFPSSAPALPEEVDRREDETTTGGESQDEVIQGPTIYPSPEAFVGRKIRPIDRWSTIRIFEVILGVAALILAVITIYLRRQTH